MIPFLIKIPWCVFWILGLRACKSIHSTWWLEHEFLYSLQYEGIPGARISLEYASWRKSCSMNFFGVCVMKEFLGQEFLESIDFCCLALPRRSAKKAHFLCKTRHLPPSSALRNPQGWKAHRPYFIACPIFWPKVSRLNWIRLSQKNCA